MTTPIEIKVNLDGDLVDVQTRLGCTNAAAISRDVWLAEPRRPAVGDAPAAGRIAIRLRSGEHDDLTVTLRACEKSQLVGRWATSFTDEEVRYRIERDWCGEGRVLSASLLSKRPPGSLRVAALRGEDVTEALDSAQRQFLVSCTPPGVAVDHLRAMGPVASTKWTKVHLGGLEVDAERWTVDDLDLFELALTITPLPGESPPALHDRAVEVQRRLHAAVRGYGLSIATETTKTEQVLTAMAAAASVHGE
ncbi:hypothetical protein ACFVAV_26000 [Nocardia sp. NPDC057663]|uniref:hypothetical protein n=1 Tax=Nocardia sp. NPDC057663 TaxID=3346201 RepID=UPI003670F9B6